MTRYGGCFCGAVRYRVDGDYLHSGICHCTSCQKVASAPSLPFVTFPLDAYAVEAAEPTIFHSSPGVTRTFCGRCGSPLTYRTEAEPGMIDVMTVSLDAPQTCPPTAHLWVSEKLPSDVIADGLRIFERGRTG